MEKREITMTIYRTSKGNMEGLEGCTQLAADIVFRHPSYLPNGSKIESQFKKFIDKEDKFKSLFKSLWQKIDTVKEPHDGWNIILKNDSIEVSPRDNCLIPSFYVIEGGPNKFSNAVWTCAFFITMDKTGKQP